jgi:hypothetical protein
LAVAILSPQQWFDNPALELFPMEVIRVLGKEEFGIGPADLIEIRTVIALNPQSLQPQIGAILTLKGEIDLAKLAAAFGGGSETIQVGNRAAYPIDGPPGAILTLVDDRTGFSSGVRDRRRLGWNTVTGHSICPGSVTSNEWIKQSETDHVSIPQPSFRVQTASRLGDHRR